MMRWRAAGSASRVRTAMRLPGLVRRLGWQAAKLGVAMGLSEGVKRLRAGPLTLRVTAPVQARTGTPVRVTARVESPFPLTACAAYFDGSWEQAPAGSYGVRNESWEFRATTPGLRPVVVTARDEEGHRLSRTRWIFVIPGRPGDVLEARRPVNEPVVVEEPTHSRNA